MDANTITQHLLSGQVGNPFEPGGGYPGSVGNVGDLVNVMPFYPGMQQQRVGSPNVQPFYPGVGAPAEQISAPPAANGLQYSQPVYPAGDVTYLGFGATTIPAGSVGTPVNVSTNRPFTPQKMGCPSTVIGLLITQVNVSGTNILANALGAPIELLSEVSTFPQVLWPSLDTATGVQFVVANPTVGDLIFSGAFYGPQLRR